MAGINQDEEDQLANNYVEHFQSQGDTHATDGRGFLIKVLDAARSFVGSTEAGEDEHAHTITHKTQHMYIDCTNPELPYVMRNRFCKGKEKELDQSADTGAVGAFEQNETTQTTFARRKRDHFALVTLTVDSDEFDRITRENLGPTILSPRPSTFVTSVKPVTSKDTSLDSVTGEPANTSPSLRTPVSKPSLPDLEPIQTSSAASLSSKGAGGFHHTSVTTHHSNSIQLQTSTGPVSSRTSAAPGTQVEPFDVKGVVVGLSAAVVTTLFICAIGLIFFYRNKRKQERLVEKEKDNFYGGRSVKRSSSQNTAESRRPILSRPRTLGEDEAPPMPDTPGKNKWNSDDVYSAPYEHVPRSLEVDNSRDGADASNRAVSPVSAVSAMLPELPTRPPPVELGNNNRANLSVDVQLKPQIPKTSMPAAGIIGIRPKAPSYRGRYSMAPPSAAPPVPPPRRSATKSQSKPRSSSAKSRGRSYTLTAVDSTESLVPASSRPSSRSPAAVSRRSSVSSQKRYSIFPKTEPVDASTVLQLPGITRPSMSRSNSWNSLKQDPVTGIPNVWTNADHQSPKASPTRGQEDGSETREETAAEPTVPELSNRASAKDVVPESPVVGVENVRISSLGNPSFESSKPASKSLPIGDIEGPAPIPPRSPLRPSHSRQSLKVIIPQPSRPTSPVPFIEQVIYEETESTPTPVRTRRNTGYRPNNAIPISPPPELPTIPLPALASVVAHNALVGDGGAAAVRGQQTLSVGQHGAKDSRKSWSVRHYSYTSNPAESASSYIKGRYTSSMFSATPTYKSYRASTTSNTSIAAPLFMDHSADQHLEANMTRSAEEALDSFFQNSGSVRPSLDSICESELQLARYVSITSTSGSRRTTIDHKPSNASIRSRSRMDSVSTIKTTTDIEDATYDDIDKAYIAPSRNRTSRPASNFSIGSSIYLDDDRPGSRQLSDPFSDCSAVATHAYSPTMSVLNFYSSQKYLSGAGLGMPQSARTSIAVRRNSTLPPAIAIPQPQLYMHSNVQILANGKPPSCANDSGLSSATSPVSYTTAQSDSPYAAETPTDVGGRVRIPTPQIYDHSPNDPEAIVLGPGMGTRPNSLVTPGPEGLSGYPPQKGMLGLGIGGLAPKPSMMNLTVSNLGSVGWESGRRSVSLGTNSTLDRSSFMDLDKGTSTANGTSSEVGWSVFSHEASANSGGHRSVSGTREFGRDEEMGINSKGASVGRGGLKRKRSGLIFDASDLEVEDRGRTRERKLV